MVLFELSNVTYKSILNIDFLKIHKNEVTCIIGESGSGKTTLLKLFNKMQSPDSGEILFENDSIKNLPPTQLRQDVMMVTQQPIMYQTTIRDELLFALTFTPKPMVDDQTLNSYLQQFNIQYPLTHPTKSLSVGEQQRIAILRSLITQPKVLCLDEPTSALDDHLAHAVIAGVVSFCKDHDITLIMVTHASSIVSQFAQRIIKIIAGKVSEVIS